MVKPFETAVKTGAVPVPLIKKINPLWWLVGDNGWDVPDINNGLPYLPTVKNIYLRRFYWFICRNPLMNFVGFVLGVEDNNYTIVGTAPAGANSGRDLTPPEEGWRFAILMPTFSFPAALFALGWFWLTVIHWAFIIPTVWAAMKAFGPLPYVNYYKIGGLEFYFGWRPGSGGFGLKIVKRAV